MGRHSLWRIREVVPQIFDRLKLLRGAQVKGRTAKAATT
jgi:hypothetical protein